MYRSQYNPKFHNTTNLNVSQKSTQCSTWPSQVKPAKKATFTHTHKYKYIYIYLFIYIKLRRPVFGTYLRTKISKKYGHSAHGTLYVWLPHLLTPVGQTKEVPAVSSVVSAVRCRWCMFLSCPLKLQRGGFCCLSTPMKKLAGTFERSG